MKFARDVSIIGVGMSKFGMVSVYPEIKDMCSGELFAIAAREAMEDAGIEPKDIQGLYVGNVMGDYMERNAHSGPYMALAAGLPFKPTVRVNDACTSGSIAIREGAIAIASGIFDLVLVGGWEMMSGFRDVQPDVVNPVRADYLLDWITRVYDPHDVPQWFDYPSVAAMYLISYAKKYGLTPQNICDLLDTCTIINHYNAARNPKAALPFEMSIKAAAEGFKNDKEFLASDKYNPVEAWPVRRWHCAFMCDGAGALVLCPAEKAKDYHSKPVDILGTGNSAAYTIYEDMVTLGMVVESADQAYRMAGIRPKDVDLLEIHDCFAPNYLLHPENVGYFEKGEGWKIILDGRTRFDGDKPVNTSGGRNALGHPIGATGCAMAYEIVKQLRGDAGERQISPLPKIGMSCNLGGGPETTVNIYGRR